MSKTLTILKYKLKIIMSDKSFIVAMAIIPLFLTFITGYALKYERENEIPIALCDLDNTEYSRMLLDRVSSKEGIKTELVNEEQAVNLVKNHKVEAAFIIKEGFQKNMIAGHTEGAIELLKSPATLSGEIIGRALGGEVSRLMLNSAAADWVIKEYENMGKLSKSSSLKERESLWSEAWQHTDSLWEPEPPMQMDYSEIKDGIEIKNSNPLSGTVEASALGMLSAFLMFLIMFNSSWLVEEKENGTIKRLIAGTNALGSVFFGNMLALLLIGVIQIIFFWATCSFIFGVHIFNNIGSILIMLLYLFATISISLFFSSIFKTRMQLQTGTPLFSIITGFMGGCFWNFADISGIAKTISLFTPQGLTLELFRNFNYTSSGMQTLTTIALIFSSWPGIIMLALIFVLTSTSYLILRHQ